MLAHHLLAANDPTFNAIRDNVLVIIDPDQNPDGRARLCSTISNMLGSSLRQAPLRLNGARPGLGAHQPLFV